jgi:hypothetical protein
MEPSPADDQTAPPLHETPPPVAAAATSSPGAGQVMIGSLLASAIAAAAFFLVAPEIFPIFKCPEELLIPMPPDEIAVAREAALSQARILNAATALGMLSLLLSVSFIAIAAAVHRAKGGVTPIRIVLSVIIATGCGFLGGLAGQFVIEQLTFVHSIDSIVRSSLSQMIGLAIFGAGLGLANGLLAKARPLTPALASGVVAGVIGGFLFPVVSGLLMHKALTDGVLIPGGLVVYGKDPTVLTVWVGITAVLTTLVIAFASCRKPRHA